MPPPSTTAPERLQKVLARAGYGSRRALEAMIRAGRVQVNGEPAVLGSRVVAGDRIRIDGRPVALPEASPRRLLAYYKPGGEVCTRSDPQDRPTVFRRLPPLPAGRWISVGRLDLNTQGLLLFSNDGEFARRLMHPSSEIEREYAVRVLGEVDQAMLTRLRSGVELDDGPARFEQLREAGGEGANRWYHVVLRSGRNRIVRRLWQSQGVLVSRLVRVRFGPIRLRRGLLPGRWEEVEGELLRSLSSHVGLTMNTNAPASPPRPRRR